MTCNGMSDYFGGFLVLSFLVVFYVFQVHCLCTNVDLCSFVVVILRSRVHVVVKGIMGVVCAW